MFYTHPHPPLTSPKQPTGSSIVDANFAVGTIVGVWPGKGLLGRFGRDQVLSLVAQYGPRVSAILAFSGTVTRGGVPLAIELTFHPAPAPGQWRVSSGPLLISPAGQTFAPGNLRATTDNPRYRQLVQHWITNRYRYQYLNNPYLYLRQSMN
jgi:sedoheptulose-bisphosphatase